MKFDTKKTVFGRHETFSLRYGWLPKGFQALTDESEIFLDDNSTVELGVGKNMVKSIRHWLRATQMTNEKDIPTELGKFLLDEKNGVDPYLEDEASLWLVHWLLASNANLATSWYWFFNCFQRTEFTSEEVLTSLKDFVRESVSSNPALGTLKADAMMILRMYSAPQLTTRQTYDDLLDAPLSMLNLLSQVTGSKMYQSRSGSRPGLPDAILTFAVAQVLEGIKGSSVPIEELMYSDNQRVSVGSVFRLSENEFIARLERMCKLYPNHLSIRDTAGISQLYILSELEPMNHLMSYYSSVKKEVA